MADMMYCWGCGKEIHRSAATCPDCGADQKRNVKGKYSSYDEVPWYRKNFAILMGIFFCPVLFLIALTGNIYYVRKGELRAYGILARLFLVIVTFIPATIVMLVLGGAGLAGLSNVMNRSDPAALAELDKAQVSNLRPDGELAEIFSLGSSYTDIQRENKLKEIIRVGPVGTNLVGTFIELTPRTDEERRIIEALKTDDLIAFKGRIADVTLRQIDLNPAVLIPAPSPTAPATASALAAPTSVTTSSTADSTSDEGSLFVADCNDWLNRDAIQVQEMSSDEARDFATETCQLKVPAFKACIQGTQYALQCASQGWEVSEDGESDENLRWLRLKQKASAASK